MAYLGKDWAYGYKYEILVFIKPSKGPSAGLRNKQYVLAFTRYSGKFCVAVGGSTAKFWFLYAQSRTVPQSRATYVTLVEHTTWNIG